MALMVVVAGPFVEEEGIDLFKVKLINNVINKFEK